jgi:polyhydroxybutyrate depolymerase
VSLPDELPERSIVVGGLRRTYRVVPSPMPSPMPSGGPAPLLIALHGGGGTGLGMARMTGFAGRGPRAGVAVAFPDGWNRAWNDGRDAPALRRREAVDDVAFLRALVDRLASDGVADPARVAAVGISNGAFLSEHLARHALLPLAAVGLVAGSATAVSRQAVPRPARPAAVTLFMGTADPIVPYAGGPIAGLGRRLAARAAAGASGRGVAVSVERVATDWVEANGLAPEPATERLPVGAGDLPVTRFTWSAAGRPPVVLYRVDGGGHTWPGGSLYLPARIIGPVCRSLDASGILLDRLASLA